MIVDYIKKLEKSISIFYQFDLIQIITSMKFTNLSNFQKEQYTNYLESQLQKFSSFMLHQRKENERYKILEDAITYQSQMISKIGQRLQLLEIYQDRNKQSYNQIHKKYSKIDDIENRLVKIQIGVGKWVQQKWSNYREMKNQDQSLGQKSSRGYEREKQEKRYQNIIKRQQQDSSSTEKSSKSFRNNPKQMIFDSKRQQNNEQKVGKKQLRKLQKKISAMLKQKFEDISLLMQKKKSRKKITPSAQTSQLSIIENYHIRQPKQIVNSFRIDDSFSKKSQQSTFMNNTQSTTKTKSKLNKEKEKSKHPHKQKSKRSISRSKSSNRSRSISKTSLNNQQKIQKKQVRRDHRKKQQINKQESFSLSEYSKSSLSRSKSPIEKNLSRISKKRLNSRSTSSKHNEISRSKSSKASKRNDPNRHLDTNPSLCHLKCKKRPQSKPQYSQLKQKDRMQYTAGLKRKVKRYIKER